MNNFYIGKHKKILGIFFFLTILFIVRGLNTDIVVTKYDIYEPKVKDDFKVVFLSDTHSCKYGERQLELLNKVYLEKADLILLGGDIIDDQLPMELGFETVERLAKFYPTFYACTWWTMENSIFVRKWSVCSKSRDFT